ncbi:MAG: hypothetical protein D6706_01630 [Chloroflexi bacterium]|nr:MAG: hypothetical protein D6706_01630 [Chloroflexota bacterium]
MVKQLREFWQRLDKGFLVVLAIAFLAIWPFISRASLPEGTDAELHIFRLYELSRLVRAGELYPRWAPDFYHGYGYPIFNYYAPLTYYLGLLVELLPRLDAVAGIKAVFVMALVGGGVGIYGFVRDNWGRPAGYVATAVFLYTPYIQYIDPHVRGVAPETLSFGLFPLALWSLDRFRREQTGVRWLTAVFTTAAVILSHNLMGLLFFGLLASWIIWQYLSENRSNGRLWLVLLLALGLSAFFWLPVIAERNAVNLNTLLGRGDNYDFHTHFLSLSELLAFSRRIDWGATQSPFRFNLGVGQWVMATVSVVLLIWQRAHWRQKVWFFVVVAGGLIFMMLPVSAFVWETVPFLPFFQFPWRLLGATAVMLAIISGAGTALLLSLLAEKWQGWATAVLVLVPLLLGLPLSQPAPWPDFGPVNILRISEIERTGRWLGTTSTADYVPATVDIIPRRNEAVVAGFYEGRPLDRVNRVTLPPETEVIGEELRPLHYRYTISAPKKFPLRLFLFDFPGWHVFLDGQPAQTELGRPEGFIVVKVPAGTHTVDVIFLDTPARMVAEAISFVSLLVTFGLARLWWKRPSWAQTATTFTSLDWYVLLSVIGLIALYLFWLEPSGSLHDNSTGQVVEPAAHSLYADFGQQIALLGFDISSLQATPGEKLSLTLYWKALKPLDINFQVFVHVLAQDGRLVAQSDKLNPGEFPTRRWPLDKYVPDQHIIELPAELPPGTYTVATGLWVQSEGWRLPLVNENGDQIGDNVSLFTLTVNRR